MTNTAQETTKEVEKVTPVKTEVKKTTDQSIQSGDQKKKFGRGKGRGSKKRFKREPREFEQKILDLARVTRVNKGGKRMRFRCSLVIGDKKGRVGLGVAKGADVAIAIDKAYRQAKKNVINIPLVNGTFPHAVLMDFGSAKILLKPAPKGTGLKCGGAIRVLLELGGVPNAVSKILGSNNKLNIATATMNAIKEMREVEQVEKVVQKVEEKKTESTADEKVEKASE